MYIEAENIPLQGPYQYLIRSLQSTVEFSRPYTVNVYTLDRRQYVSRVLKTNKSDNHKILIAVK